MTGDLEPLPAAGWYLDYEHQWKEWELTRVMKLRSSFIWSFVAVDNLDFQLPEAYRKTNRYSANLVFSPTPRIDSGIEYIYGTRQNLDGLTDSADQSPVRGDLPFLTTCDRHEPTVYGCRYNTDASFSRRPVSFRADSRAGVPGTMRSVATSSLYTSR